MSKKSKRVMVIDRCMDCTDYLPVTNKCMAANLEGRDCGKTIPAECPLPKLPPTRAVDVTAMDGGWFAEGWNACLKAIGGD